MVGLPLKGGRTCTEEALVSRVQVFYFTGSNGVTMQVAILAGGLATRLRPLTQDQPKSMVRVLGRPFLEYQLEFLRRNGITAVVLCIGYLGEQIEGYFGDGGGFGVDIRYSREDKPLGTAGALKNARGLLADEFFTLYGIPTSLWTWGMSCPASGGRTSSNSSG